MRNDNGSFPTGRLSAHAIEETMVLITAMEAAQTEAEVLRQVLAYVGRFGAKHVLAGSMPLAGMKKRQQVDHILLNGWPTDWVMRYFDQDYVRHDPTIRMIKEKHAPFFWQDIEAQRLFNLSARDVMGEAGEFGLRAGFTIGLQTLQGALIGFSIGGERIEIREQERAGLQLMATFAIERALQLQEMDQFPLTHGVSARERRALQLAADGLRDQEIAVRMGISHHGAEKHLRAVRDKLEAKNTTNAIAIAMRLGMLR